MANGWAQLRKRIEEGYGQGHYDRYKPWITIRRGRSSSHGNQVVEPLPGYVRASHFLAAAEWHLALLLRWLGAHDIREQFPLWPFPHPHPLADSPLNTLGRLPESVGLIEIARQAGIDHGTEIGTKGVPYVATNDLLVTVPTSAAPRLVPIAAKRHAVVAGGKPTDRPLERLELERRYFAQLGEPLRIAHEKLLSKALVENLEWLRTAASKPDRNKTLIDEFALTVSALSVDESLEEAIAKAGERFHFSPTERLYLFRHCAWHNKIVVDITDHILMSYPLQQTGAKMRARLYETLLGDAT